MTTRRDEIHNAKLQFIKTLPGDVNVDLIEHTFHEAAKWADENPSEKIMEALKLVDESWHGEYGVAFIKSKDGSENTAEQLLIEFNFLKQENDKSRQQLAIAVTALQFCFRHGYLCGHDDPSWCEARCKAIHKAKEALLQISEVGG